MATLLANKSPPELVLTTINKQIQWKNQVWNQKLLILVDGSELSRGQKLYKSSQKAHNELTKTSRKLVSV